MDDPNVCSFLQDPVLGYPQSFPERHALRRCELNDPLPCDDQFWFLYIKTEVAGSDEEIAALLGNVSQRVKQLNVVMQLIGPSPPESVN